MPLDIKFEGIPDLIRRYFHYFHFFNIDFRAQSYYPAPPEAVYTDIPTAFTAL
ncbi:uncharacterized protein RSE6_07517 [Rhynchosporium secalis]|uniref:Uncharacterized protein n=1 Tax=Rhynchosporium secalis TaxID=38038 RepID=A0A1E1MD55_RHYSE|nr:uncharacterized protein RSE6_07517 [Rhynchosporium secalis]